MLLLDTNVLGVLCHKDRKLRERASEHLAALRSRAATTFDLAVPEIADFELRRKLLHIGASWSLTRLDAVAQTLVYLPLTTSIMKDAARIWAEARRRGSPTASPHSLDGDAILAAQAQSVGGRVATTNRKHLAALGVAIEDMGDLTNTPPGG